MKTLTKQDYVEAANDLDVPLAHIRAFAFVESKGSGFIGNEPKILFEGHRFWKNLKKRGIEPRRIQTPENRDVLYRKWTKRYYLGGSREHSRLQKAVKIHKSAALESASWGMFQIMGEHWRTLRYESLQAFINDMYSGEDGHLRAFIRFIKSNPQLHEALKLGNWKKVARLYNGKYYWKNQYSVKLKRAAKRFRG